MSLIKRIIVLTVLAINCDGQRSSIGAGISKLTNHHHNHYNGHRSNRIVEGDIGDLRCVKLMSEVKWTETTMTAKLPPDVDGTWVSLRCEVRPGPKFLLRKYHFGDNQTFQLHQFYYSDDKCSTPSYVFLVDGTYQLTNPSWLVPGGMDADYILNRVQVLSYTEDGIEELATKMNTSCPSVSIGSSSTSWIPRRLYTIFRYVDIVDDHVDEFDIGDKNDIGDINENDINCLDAFDIVFHELQLMRVEYRRSRHRIIESKKFWKGRKVELLLGNVNEDIEQRHYRPTSYQQPLAKADQLDVSCTTCRIISKATLQYPPIHPSTLTTSLPVPVRLSGEWLSTRCETRTNSMFLTRRLLFYDDRHSSWKGFYEYFVDPKCQSLIFSLVASGRVEIGNTSLVTDGATDVDFLVEHLKVTTHSAAMVNNLNALSSSDTCGKLGTWALGVPQDITSSGGCVGLGLRVPSREMEIVKMELDKNGNVWLFIGADFEKMIDGDDDLIDAEMDGESSRPTSYQWPLLQCQEFLMTFDYDQSNSLSPINYADDTGIKSSRYSTDVDRDLQVDSAVSSACLGGLTLMSFLVLFIS